MDATMFAQAMKEEKDAMVANYIADTESSTGALIQKLKEAGAGEDLIKELLDTALTDVLYMTLLGLDGQMPIGPLTERSYRLAAPDSTLIATGDGTLAEAAYAAFYGGIEE
ncbi:MAG: hypothetical protein K6F45_00785 [Saccharofermentans sp.]|nr:hypothetical protein [Saccharofermentans sp.]